MLARSAPTKPGRFGCHDGEVEISRELHLLRVQLEDFRPSLDIGTIHQDLPIEAPGTEQRGVEDLRPVGGGHDDDSLIRIEPIHLGQELIEGLFPLVVARKHAHSPSLSDGIELIDEYDAGRTLHCLHKKIPDPCRADADKHFDEVRTRQG